MAAPVAELMEGRPMPVDRLKIGVRSRHLDVVVGWAVEGAVAADAEVSAGPGDQCLGLRQDQPVCDRRRYGYQALGEVFALVRVEDREPLEERDCARLIAIAFRPFAFVIGNE